MSDDGLTLRFEVHLSDGRRRRKRLVEGPAPKPPTVPVGRVPRVARLMALAIKLHQQIRDGELADYAEIARLGHVTRARVTQLMNLLHLAPDIQEAILFLPPVEHGRDPVTERDLRPIVTIVDWRKQRKLWSKLLDRALNFH